MCLRTGDDRQGLLVDQLSIFVEHSLPGRTAFHEHSSEPSVSFFEHFSGSGSEGPEREIAEFWWSCEHDTLTNFRKSSAFTFNMKIQVRSRVRQIGAALRSGNIARVDRKVSLHSGLGANESRADGADFLDRILLVGHLFSISSILLEFGELKKTHQCTIARRVNSFAIQFTRYLSGLVRFYRRIEHEATSSLATRFKDSI